MVSRASTHVSDKRPETLPTPRELDGHFHLWDSVRLHTSSVRHGATSTRVLCKMLEFLTCMLLILFAIIFKPVINIDYLYQATPSVLRQLRMRSPSCVCLRRIIPGSRQRIGRVYRLTPSQSVRRGVEPVSPNSPLRFQFLN